MSLYTIIWFGLALVLLALIGYRKLRAREEDDTVHVSGANWSVADKQRSVAHVLDQIDRWKWVLTIAVIVYGLVLGAIYVNNVWQAGQRLPY